MSGTRRRDDLCQAPGSPRVVLGRFAAGMLVSGLLASCALSPRVSSSGAEGAVGRDEAALGTDPLAGVTAADVAFVRGMIQHHAQALWMAALVADRSSREDLQVLARRILVSQRDEIELMRSLLEARGQLAPELPLPPPGGGAPPHLAHGRGMLAEAELNQLAAARGTEFDRLFLELMIRHHEGALTMVAELFAAAGSAQEAEIFDIAAQVEADQRAEIARMQRLLANVP